ncbi:MAG: CPBP family intramembrane glutamic endopeptidase [Ginsengibacter sp.]
MDQQITFQRIIHFFLTKIIIGIAVVGGSVALIEWAGRSFLYFITIADKSKDIIISISEAAVALVFYIFLFRFYEKRQVKELSSSTLSKNAIIGLATGITLQSLFILIIYMAGHYSILSINPLTFIIPGFMQALTAGFVAELLLCGIIFRLTEEKFGTVIALIISASIFAVAHGNVKGATFISICATSLQAGIMLNAAYVFSRSLWLPIFLHLSWDFAEPSIYGGINPGISILKSLFESKISGPVILSGGQFGPQNSIQSLLLCSLLSFIFLWFAKRKNNIIKPYWTR